MLTAEYHSGMADRRRKPRNVTLNPALVDEVLALGESVLGETNLSRLLDEAMRLFVQKYRKAAGDKPAADAPERRR